jgi:putative sterol carrier protein
MTARSTLHASLDELKARLTPEQTADLELTVQFEIGGDPGGIWHAVISGGDLCLGAGPAAAPNVTMQMSSQDWFDMVAGNKTSLMLYMIGRLKVKGDMMLAIRLASLLRI